MKTVTHSFKRECNISEASARIRQYSETVADKLELERTVKNDKTLVSLVSTRMLNELLELSNLLKK